MGVSLAVADYGCFDVIATFVGASGGSDVFFPIGSAAETHSEDCCDVRMAELPDQSSSTDSHFKEVPSRN